MEEKNTFTKALTILGTALEGYPFLRVGLDALGSLLPGGHSFTNKYLLPVPIFVWMLIGGGLLVWAASRAKQQKVLISRSYKMGIGVLLAGAVLAPVLGLDTDVIRPNAYRVAHIALGLYALANVVTLIGGIQLLRDLFRDLHK